MVEISPVNTAADLDLTGEIVYAINFGNNGNPTVGGVVFSQDQECPGISLHAEGEGPANWWGPYPATGDPGLDLLLNGLAFKSETPYEISVDVKGLLPGTAYLFQIIGYEPEHTGRTIDISFENQEIVAGFNPLAAQGGVTGHGGLVIKCRFTASDPTLTIRMVSHYNACAMSGLILSKVWPPLPDFNGDFKIDIEDLVMLIEHWGQHDPSFDLAPPPAGDGIVDRQDLEVFMSYWGQELRDPLLLAHWKLDEAEGGTAHDSAGENDTSILGDAVWQPSGGKIGGALAFDGVDDFIPTDFALDPGEGPFSVFAWIKGGAPGQVVVSQMGGADWLCANPADGTLMTNLMDSSRQAKRGLSNIVVTDGQWHHVGLVWDGSNRILYVDDKQAAKDAQSTLAGRGGALTIGAGYALAPGSFWSGLIDDVRIYNRAVTP
jgi:hypothetical protein